MHSRQISLGSVLVAIILAGCATPVSTGIKPSEANVAKYKDLSDLNVVTALEKNVNEAKAANMPFLAPYYFLEATKILKESQNALGNKPKDVLVNNAAKADALLEKGRAMMDIAKYRFAKELELKMRLDLLETAKLLPAEYEKNIGELSRLIEKIQREKPDNIDIDKDKEALFKAMQELEIKSVQEGALRETAIINADSQKKNAAQQAPITFAEALRVYQAAKDQIAAAHHDEKLVRRLGAQALFAARHAQQINDRVALIQEQLNITASGGGTPAAAAGKPGAQQGDGKAAGAEKATIEIIILQEEGRLLGIAAALGVKDLRDLPLEKQAEEIMSAAKELVGQPDEVPGTTSTMKGLQASLKAANDATQQALTRLAEKEQQLAAKNKLLETQAAQLAEKDAQIKTLNDIVSQFGDDKSTLKPKSEKPRAAKPQGH